MQAKRRWNCSISVGNKTKSLGTFLDEAEAARAYDMAAIKEHPAPILNFLADGRYVEGPGWLLSEGARGWLACHSSILLWCTHDTHTKSTQHSLNPNRKQAMKRTARPR